MRRTLLAVSFLFASSAYAEEKAFVLGYPSPSDPASRTTLRACIDGKVHAPVGAGWELFCVAGSPLDCVVQPNPDRVPIAESSPVVIVVDPSGACSQTHALRAVTSTGLAVMPDMTSYLDVPCSIVSTVMRAKCVAQHKAAGIGLEEHHGPNGPRLLSKDEANAEASALAREYTSGAATSKWRYFPIVDEMTSQEVHMAEIESVNTLNFGFPYQGEQKMTLTLRSGGRHGAAAMLSVKRGQFRCSTYSCGVVVRADDGPLKTLTGNVAADGDSTIIFLSYNSILGLLKKAKTLAVAATFYQNGSPVVMFEVDGFDPARLASPKKRK